MLAVFLRTCLTVILNHAGARCRRDQSPNRLNNKSYEDSVYSAFDS